MNLSSIVINKLHITEIVKKPGKYFIYMNNSSMDGFCMFASGRISTTYNIIEICKTNNQSDYKVVRDWIKTIK